MNTIDLTCQSCLTIFSRRLASHTDNLKHGRTNTFCSSECSRVSKLKGTIGQQLMCLNCSTPFTAKATDQKFCNRSCSASHNNAKIPKRKAKLFCSGCNIAIGYRNQNQLCVKCNSERISNYNSTITLAELKSQYSISQYHAKLRGWARLAYNGPLYCANDKYDLQFDVAHIKSVASFPLSTLVSVVNDPSNLIALCKRCHWEFDNGYLTLP